MFSNFLRHVLSHFVYFFFLIRAQHQKNQKTMASTNPVCVDGAAKAVAPPHVIDIANTVEDDNNIIDVEKECMKTPSPKRQTQLQKVFDLLKESAEATYHWMR